MQFTSAKFEERGQAERLNLGELHTVNSNSRLESLRPGTDCPNIRNKRSEQVNVSHLPIGNIYLFAAFAANIWAVSTRP